MRGLRWRTSSPENPSRVEGARAEVLHQHVRGLEQLPEDLAARRRLEVQGDAPLAAVHGEEVRASSVHKGRAPAAGVVALAGLLDLDHVGARVREGLGAIRPGEDAGEVDDA